MPSEIIPTPERYRSLGYLSKGLKAIDDFGRSPFGYSNPPVEILSNAVKIPELYRALENAAYGSPLTRGTGQARSMAPDTQGALDALLSLAPLARLKALSSAAPRVIEKAAQIPEHKMLQGIYRGYAGDNPNLGILGSEAQRYYGSPQKQVADIYAKRYAELHGAEPHVEMLMVDPFAGERYPHIPTVTRDDPSTFTMARELAPEEIKRRYQLYARGGLAQYKECNCHG